MPIGAWNNGGGVGLSFGASADPCFRLTIPQFGGYAPSESENSSKCCMLPGTPKPELFWVECLPFRRQKKKKKRNKNWLLYRRPIFRARCDAAHCLKIIDGFFIKKKTPQARTRFPQGRV
jgi:hypothetical protein